MSSSSGGTVTADPSHTGQAGLPGEKVRSDSWKGDLAQDSGASPIEFSGTASAYQGDPASRWRLPMGACSSYETRRDRFGRSRLSLPGDSPKRPLNAGPEHLNAMTLDLRGYLVLAPKAVT